MSKSSKGAVIITGSSRGIGQAIATALARDGFAVVINYLKDAQGAEKTVDQIIAQGGQASLFQADVALKDAVGQMVKYALEKYGVLSGVVHNASPHIDNKEFLQTTWEDVERQMDVHFKGAFHLCSEALPTLLEQGHGVVVNITSTYTENVPPAKMFSYVAAKSALISLTRSLAVEYGPKNIRFNCVSPGMTETDLIQDVPDKVKIMTKMQTPLRRLGTPQDVAEAVAFLFSDKAAYITGQTLRVCGGSVMA